MLIISLLDIYVINMAHRSTEDSFLFTTFTLVVNLIVFIRYLIIVRASVSKQVLSPATVAHLTDVLWRFMLYLLTYSGVATRGGKEEHSVRADMSQRAAVQLRSLASLRHSHFPITEQVCNGEKRPYGLRVQGKEMNACEGGWGVKPFRTVR